ncbi:hypothetical protein [Desulfosporosinus lacus]|uniref:Uncharacterized protein n=1 Tax=Desulfosporosinus lacus DSM 15449 TaxID=1121420 RepID=A0A1M5ZJ05_9FIRM|nr:hypothetical protein [Desulfosporosinus lacus]SHI24121.1 hypothetical protein SAMN02746098_03309 [Desulfosporosinus lacus DSM 15449]
MRKKWPRLFYTSMAIGLACVLGFSEQIFSATTATPSLSSFSGTAVTRLEGIDQYETASKIAGHVMSSLPLPLPGSTQPTVKVLKIQMHTVPAYNSDEMSNDLTFDMSGAQDKTQVTGFSVTVDQPCDLQLDKIDKIIPLSGGQATLVNLDDLISGTHGGNGISLKTFRAFYGDSVSIQGELKKNGSVVGNLSITIKL